MPRKTTTKAKNKPVTKKASSSKKQKANKEMEFADGKVEDNTAASRNIEQILATRKNNPFGTTSPSDFDEKVSDMNLSQMQEMAVKASIFPSGNKTSLKNKLKREFSSRFGGSGGFKHMTQTEVPLIDPDSDQARQILDILNS
jgi:hypothetical protein